MGRVLVTLFVSFCLRCNFFSSLRGGREGAASFGSSALPLNHIAKIWQKGVNAKGFWNANCTTLHNLNFTLKRLWCSRQNESVCMEMQTYRLVFFQPRLLRLNYQLFSPKVICAILFWSSICFLLFSFVFTMFFKLAALRQKITYNFNHTGRFFFDNWLHRAKGLWQINGDSCF